jgi:antitoxin YefM
MSDFISISDARATLPDLINKISKNMERITITVNGKPKAVVLSSEELESLEETAEVLVMPNILEDLAKSRKQFKEGKFVTLEDLK